MHQPLACPTCRSGDAARDAEVWRSDVRCIDESHLGVTLVRCPACATRALRIFTELIDWQGGDDSQATLLVPLPPDEAVDAAALAEEEQVAALLGRLPIGAYLARICPRGMREAPVWEWRQGRGRILPHD